MNGHYRLKGHEPVPVEDAREWGRWFETSGPERIVAQDDPIPGVQVSTVFLGLDHNFGRDGGPMLFETMVFGGELDEEQVRYSTWKEAEAGHKEMVRRVKELS
ncbi:MAG TPA: hypothetical protein VN921_01355 [Chthoniobacterales bacterium]|nr:hypothetical protein [Chthoniobacterales bacterium]